MASALVMISHSSQDSALAQSLCEALERRGMSCWIAPRDLAPGEDWAEGIVRGIESCEAMALIVSENINASPHVLNEITQAVHLGRLIYPIVVGEVRLTRSLDYYLRPRHWLFADGESLEKAVEVLQRALTGQADWERAASPPSIRRRLRHGSFDGLVAGLAGSALTAVVVLGALLWGWQGMEQRREAREAAHYQSIGWIAPASAVRSDTGSGGESDWRLSGSVFLAGDAPRFDQVSLSLAPATQALWPPMDLTDGLDRTAVTPALNFSISRPIPQLEGELVFCLQRPHPVLGTTHRVEQHFNARQAAARQGEQRVEFVAASEPRVVAAPSKPCGG